MKRVPIFFLLLLTTLILSFVPSALAQRWDWDADASIGQLRSFDSFLGSHPEIAKKLWEKPQRVNDNGFLNHNKEIKQWLEDHPAAANAFRNDPDGFMERERRFRIYSADLSGSGRRHELARFDWFLDSHPDIRRDLTHKPQLVNRRDYLDYHPELRAFLNRHPVLRDEVTDHPKEFMEREAHFERGM